MLSVHLVMHGESMGTLYAILAFSEETDYDN